MYANIYVYYRKDLSEIRLYDTWNNLKEHEEIDSKNRDYGYFRAKTIVDLLIRLQSNRKEIRYENIEFYMSKKRRKELCLDTEEGLKEYINIAEFYRQCGNKGSRFDTIDGFIKGKDVKGFPLYTIRIDEEGTPTNFMSVLMNTPYVINNNSLLAELHATLRLIKYGVEKEKKINIYTMDRRVIEIFDLNYSTTIYTEVVQECRKQYKRFLEIIEEKNENITDEVNHIKIKFYHLMDESIEDYEVFKDVRNILNNNLEKLENELTKPNIKSDHSEEIRDLNVTTICDNRARELIMEGHRNRTNKYIFTGNYLYLYYEDLYDYNNRKFTDDELLMLITLSPDIQYMINKRLEQEKEYNKTKYITRRDNHYETDNRRHTYIYEVINIDYLTQVVKKSGQFLITDNTGLCKHGVIDIIEAIPIKNSEDAYCMQFVESLIVAVSRVNYRFLTGNNKKYESFPIPITIKDNKFVIAPPVRGYRNSYAPLYKYKLHLYAYSGRKSDLVELRW